MALAQFRLLLSRTLVAGVTRSPQVQPPSFRGHAAPPLWVRDGLCRSGTVSRYSELAGRGEGPAPGAAVVSSALTDLPLPGSLPCLVDLDGAPPLSPFEEISEEEAVQIVALPPLPPVSTALRDYVNQSETLRMLVHLGVDLSKLQARRNVGSMLLRMGLQDLQERLLFLRDLGLQEPQLGPLLTRNPFILTETLQNLRARVSYLRSKQFSSEEVGSMVCRAPYLLNFSVQRMDNRLGFYQTLLGLSPQKTRDIVTRLPRLLCGSLEPVKENLKVCELELGFRPNEIQHVVTRIPKLLTANKKRLRETFDYVHNKMAIPHALIVKFPQVLNASLLRIRERHLFLQYLGKAQYDPAQPGYVPLDLLVSLPDPEFCSELATASLQDFELFQKTL
ncbi:transcription termination factor 3, mitochondrial [Anguilla anguilla]|uniref:transcription termination factor 3, mitochondrial n=1 Tax=Anguilla anguilla TaxID=7936 RepID=UPI0015AFC5F9|nr:transcription termination factor 3, mitochondrial [Anguilla anguilla]